MEFSCNVKFYGPIFNTHPNILLQCLAFCRITEYADNLSDFLLIFVALTESLDRYIHAATVCNSLALLVSQGSSKEFAVRIALLSLLQKCWLNGHLILKLECSCDGTVDCISDEFLCELNSRASSDAGINLSDSMRNLSDIQPAKQCDSIDNFEASSHFPVELTSECMNRTESTEEKSIISTDGMQCAYCIQLYMYIVQNIFFIKVGKKLI